ncbi:membrane glycosyltransferase [Humitalea rosea]|uniref:Membrane glycosyltransferase n=1 Tax=Humitalea rosea TaxID=990373 RepID=A0A2W7IM86_9PROT|nr:glucans biosynthesis glucosyltransferase MdoH [Humitalea rosea]PZW48295.1 membrane glycosyltransferase [Humitalea rosea]
MDTLTTQDLHIEALPPAAPLAMPEQDFSTSTPARQPTGPRGIGWRRLLVISGAIVMTLAATREMSLVLNGDSMSTLEVLILFPFVLLFAWVAVSFTSALAGFCIMLIGDGSRLLPGDGPLPPLRSRTALLMATYNEPPARIFAGIEAIHDSLLAAGVADAFDLFVLSDTTDPDIWVAEEAHWQAMRGRLDPAARIYYRRRRRNVSRKTGNIAEWVTRFGAAYEHFLILDADSLMEGEALHHLAAAMEATPDAGLVQSLPVSISGQSLLARMQQFAGRIYGPLIAQGIAWWHGAEGNYWGHNAIIRTRAFAEAAGLPHLRGRKPFGGDILSHDFVEAALLRRAGWGVHMLPLLRGSYEQGPPTLMDIAVRDRRWAQGNLQHAAVLPTRGLHWVSRLHLLTGIGSYITAPLWLLFLLLGFCISLEARFVRPEYFPAAPTLFPHWPLVDPVRAMWVFAGTMMLLLIPKVLALLVFLLNGQDRRAAGGAIRLVLSMLLETLIAAMLSPITMLTQTVQVIAILRGRDSGWSAQSRDDGRLPLGVVVRGYWLHTVLGVGAGIAAWLVSPWLALWMSPVLAGLVLAIPLVWLTARPGAGATLRWMGLLLIPEERRPPEVLTRALALRGLGEPAGEAASRLAGDAALLRLHRRLLPPPRRRGIDPLDVDAVLGEAKLAEADDLGTALRLLTPKEKAAVLAEGEGVERLVSLARA